MFLIALLGAVIPVARAGDPAYRIRILTGHPWLPPFGLDCVGQTPTAQIELRAQPLFLSDFVLSVLLKGKEVGRHSVRIPSDPAYSALVPVPVPEYGDEVVLSAIGQATGRRMELARQPLGTAPVELDAVARPETLINPVDLGTVLVPHGWLLLGPGQGSRLDIAAIRRDGDEPLGRVLAWFGSAPAQRTTARVALQKGRASRLTIRLPEPSTILDRDVVQVALEDGRGAELARKSIPVMLVQKSPRWPRFGATYTKLRYDAPISVRDPKTGSYSSLEYEKGWDPALQDVVVSFPSGARFVFWRGSSYIPFWAGKHNTGACYEWAEIISRLEGAVDCVEPLMDKELRYGRVEIVESTPARVHVRWRYQSTDLNYKVWGDQSVEDYYFYPDGFGTRVLSLTADAAHDYELSEFIILTPQGAYPFDVLPEKLVDAIGLDGRKWSLTFPSPEGQLDAWKKAMTPPCIYRLRLNKEEPMSAIYFNPLDREFPEVIFAPFMDRGQVVTPCYWGSHWPLARGNATGFSINDRIFLTPCHNSVMSWARIKPDPIRSTTSTKIDARGGTKTVSVRQWAWLIGMTEASDSVLRQWAWSYRQPPSIDVREGTLAFDAHAPERRAMRFGVKNKNLRIKLNPAAHAMNPVFELSDAPAGSLTVWRDGNKMTPEHFAWDGRTLWLDATVEKPTEIHLEFGSPPR
jgi:hypothetical protein